MHFRGLLRIAGREGGVRLYAARDEQFHTHTPAQALDALVEVVVQKYAPLPERSLSELVSRLRFGAPQWAAQVRAALARAKTRLPQAQVDGLNWYWPEGENPASKRHQFDDEVRLLAPFDPVVWDRRRFELFWGWAYRFEAYTPAPKRVRGYYALPLLWRGQLVGWGNVAVKDDGLQAELGYVSGKAPRERDFKPALDAELARLGAFLGL
jgi:uncharacterized protein YcaQ